MEQKLTAHAALFLVGLLLMLSGCRNDNNGTEPVESVSGFHDLKVETPMYSVDSAFSYIARQVDFGPRVPGTIAHDSAAEWLADMMRKYAGENNVRVQQSRVQLFNKQTVELTNIITAINPEIKENRLLLCAHWDSRMVADHDDDESVKRKPILGANDGASGVGLLIELNRVVQSMPLKNIGIDIVFFDVEDQGTPDLPEYPKTIESNKTWCLGSQHWAAHRHQSDYSYHYGILLDMVGGNNAQFRQEGYSLQFAPHVVQKVWTEARLLGYSQYFTGDRGREILDDHFYVNTVGGIPCIDIIDLQSGASGFHPAWHTQSDNMEIIDKGVLEAVGKTLLNLIYKEDAASASL